MTWKKTAAGQIGSLPVALLLLMASCGTSAPPSAVPNQPPAPVLPAWTPSLHLADVALSGGAPAVALQVSDEMLAKDPNNVGALVRRGNALTALDRPGEATASYNMAVTLRPDDSKALAGLGRLLLNQNPGAAEAIFERMMLLDPHDALALSNLGVARDLQGHHSAAQVAYHMALGLTPTSIPIQVNLGLSMALSGDAAGAVRVLQPLATVPDAAPRIRQDLAVALTLSGRRDEAMAVVSVDLPPDQIRSVLDGFEALRP